MFNFIKGNVVDITPESVVIENNGIGYEIGASLNTVSSVHVGDNVKIYTYLHVREDAVALYGFLKLEEKKLFLKLIDISGIGPKMAMQILSGCDFKTLTISIATGDVKTLTKIKGLGKKTAELIVVHLKDKLGEDMMDVDSPVSMGGVLTDDCNEAVEVLVTLGVNKADAIKQVTDLSKDIKGAENLIAAVLRSRG